MNKGLIIAIIAVLGVVAVVGYLATNRSDNSPRTNSQTQPQAEAGQSGTLSDLLGLGSNQQCTFSDNEGNEGVVYVANEQNVRGDFTTTTESETTNSHMILNGDEMYIWMDGETTGFKASLDATEEAQAQVSEFMSSSEGSFDANQEVDYDCRSWSVDNSKFDVPGTVEFQDLSAMMESLGDVMMEDTTEQCGVCDSLSGDAATQCRQALGC